MEKTKKKFYLRLAIEVAITLCLLGAGYLYAVVLYIDYICNYSQVLNPTEFEAKMYLAAHGAFIALTVAMVASVVWLTHDMLSFIKLYNKNKKS